MEEGQNEQGHHHPKPNPQRLGPDHALSANSSPLQGFGWLCGRVGWGATAIARLRAWRRMPDAFVLFKTEPSQEHDVYMALDNHSEVAEVHALYGEFDLLVRISSTDSKALSELLMNTFRRIEGVRETQTMIAVEGA